MLGNVEPYFVWIGGIIWLINAFVVAHLARKKNTMFFFLWPSLIYSIGPVASLAYLDTNALQGFIDPQNILAESLLSLLLTFTLIAADKFLHLDRTLSRYIYQGVAFLISETNAIRVTFFVAVVTASTLQMWALIHYGSILSGQYLLEAFGAENGATIWGFISGSYEVVLTCMFSIVMWSKKKPPPIFTALYIGSLILRIFGGTRLILVKDAAVLLYALMCRGKIPGKSIFFVAAGMIFIGSLVGEARNAGGANALFGPAQSVLAEAGLSALTLNIAYDVYTDQKSKAADASDTAIFIIGSLAPSFLTNLFFPREDLSNYNPYSMAFKYGYTTFTPVGAMNLFASIIYVTGSPWFGTIFLILFLAAFIKIKYNNIVKSAILTSFAINSINMWRDPLDISLKLIFQCSIVFIVVYFMAYAVSIKTKPIETYY